MCEVCKADQKCEHPWPQCLASRGEPCAVYDSSAPRRPYSTQGRDWCAWLFKMFAAATVA